MILGNKNFMSKVNGGLEKKHKKTPYLLYVVNWFAKKVLIFKFEQADSFHGVLVIICSLGLSY